MIKKEWALVVIIYSIWYKKNTSFQVNDMAEKWAIFAPKAKERMSTREAETTKRERETERGVRK